MPVVLFAELDVAYFHTFASCHIYVNRNVERDADGTNQVIKLRVSEPEEPVLKVPATIDETLSCVWFSDGACTLAANSSESEDVALKQGAC